MSGIADLIADMIDPPNDNWEPLPHQIAPSGRYFCWLLLGGRGAGKTAAAARAFHDHIHGPPCVPGVPGGHWPSIIAPTLGDGVTSCVNGPSGLRLHCPDLKLRNTTGGTTVRWPNGTEAKIFGAHTPEDVERLRSGGNRCFVWAEELAAWRYLEACWQHMRYGLRVGPWPHVIASTTPKPKAMLKKLIADPETRITRATTADNPHLDERVKKALYEDYGGTREGRQELYAEMLMDIVGALWTPEIIDDARLAARDQPEQYDRIIVGVDPAATKGGDETGITVAGMVRPFNWLAPDRNRADQTHGFVLADYSLNGSPDEWGHAVVDAYHDWQADLIVPEVNNGGEMVTHTIRTIDADLPIYPVNASRGKMIRAEPVSALYQQGRVHHVGNFTLLEEQMCTWDPIEPDLSSSPDRMDSLVWALTELMVRKGTTRKSSLNDTRLRGRR